MTPREEMLRLLKQELQFVESGGYRTSPRSHWRPRYIFEESPSCPNYGDRSRPHSCEECWLMAFVSSSLREEQAPCRFVRLSSDQLTVDSLYQHATQQESEETLHKWLQEQIQQLEAETSQAPPTKASNLLWA